MKPESIVSQEIMIEAAKHGVVFMRNNSGAGVFVDEKSGQQSYVRFGLMNTSKEQNKRIKSSDLIAFWKPFGLFVAVEVKKEGWVYNPKNEREVAQKAFIDFVNAGGGRAGFCQSVDDFLRLIGR